jgi:ATP-dependent exoDNAse (exonuclease V) alpha subunit
MGRCSPDVIEFFDECVKRELEEPTKLFPTNQESFNYNMRRLNHVQSPEMEFDAKIEGRDDSRKAQIIKNCIADQELIIKVGAPVIILTNNKVEGYVNGMRGVLKSISDDSCVVEVDGGTLFHLTKFTWELNGPRMDENGDPEVLASFTQFPIKLAYSLTMHKSQGMSIERLSLNLTNCFESGQAYVALSRAKTKEGLSLSGRLSPNQIFVSPRLAKYHKSIQSVERSQV